MRYGVFRCITPPAVKALLTSLIAALFWLLSAHAWATLSGPSSDADGRFTLAFSPIAGSGTLTHYLNVYRDDQYSTRYNLSSSQRSHDITVLQSGRWRFDYVSRREVCIVFFDGECEESIVRSNTDSHSVNVTVNSNPTISIEHG